MAERIAAPAEAWMALALVQTTERVDRLEAELAHARQHRANLIRLARLDGFTGAEVGRATGLSQGQVSRLAGLAES